MRGRSWRWTIRSLAVAVAAMWLSTTVWTQEKKFKGGQEEFGHYEIDESWPKPLPDGPDGVKHDGWTFGSNAAVFAESPDRIWFAMRGELPLPKGAKPWTTYAMLGLPSGDPNYTERFEARRSTGNPDRVNARCLPSNSRGWERRMHHVIFVVDSEGNQVEHWQQHDALFEHPCGRGPHKIKMSPYDPDKHVWVIDDQLHQIHKFSYDGKLVMTLGTRAVRGRDTGKLFDRPTDIAWLADGTFFISDGYGGKRVAKFDKNGKFLMDWGSAPKDPDNPGPNEWNTVHSIATSKDGRVFVADRGNHRMQVFDKDGKFLDMFSLGKYASPYFHMITDDQSLWVSDGHTDRFSKYDLDGNFKYGWGGPGPRPGEFEGPHQFSVDQDGNLYVAEVFNGRIQRFTPRAGADPAKLVGQEVRYKR